MISRRELRARLNLPKRRVKGGCVEVFESHNFQRGFGNWGDHISAEIVAHYSKVIPAVCSDPLVAGKTLVVGSVMSNAMPGDSVWGAGCIAPGAVGFSRGKMKVYAVRGPLTLKELRKCHNIPNVPFGDPALLMRSMHKFPTNSITHEYGVIPHWVDYDLPVIKRLSELGMKIIDIRQATSKMLDELSNVRKVLSSSLHGLILSDAMNLPNGRVQFSSRVIGGDFKFQDYCQSVGRRHVNHPLDQHCSIQKIERIALNDSLEWDADAILNKAPWNAE